MFVSAFGVAVAGAELATVGGAAAVGGAEAAVDGAEAAGVVEAVLLVVTMGTDCNTADWTTDWMTKGLALSCLGGGLDRLTMMSDMACCAWAR